MYEVFFFIRIAIVCQDLMCHHKPFLNYSSDESLDESLNESSDDSSDYNAVKMFERVLNPQIDNCLRIRSNVERQS